MRITKVPGLCLLSCILLTYSCKKEKNTLSPAPGTDTTMQYTAVQATFGNNIDLKHLQNYASQTRPGYITKDNSGSTPITDAGATLGRVLFYDKNLSVTNTIACASCHKQELAFGDNALLSPGANGTTARHAMRLVNARFSQEMKFFWDERATSLESQTTQPIQNHNEMGYSGQSGDKNLDDLINKLEQINYYKELFAFVYGDDKITEARLQNALSQFVRSIQSFDSKFDAGLAQVNNLNQDFPNFTAQENAGKRLFLAPPPGAPGATVTGAGCQACHRAPEFDIDPNTRNNGIVTIAGNTAAIDITNTRAPSLRNIVNANGIVNGPFMHDGSKADLPAVINHYNLIPVTPGNTNLDPRLTPAGQPQNLQLTAQQKNALVAFLSTLGGIDVYTNSKWSNPFK